MRALLIFIAILTSAEVFAVCGHVLKDVQAPVVGGVGRYFLGAGEIYPAKGRNKEGTKYTLLVGSELVAVDRSAVRLLRGEICDQKKAPLPDTAQTPPPASEIKRKDQSKEFVPLDENVTDLSKEEPSSPSPPAAQSPTAREDSFSPPPEFDQQAGPARSSFSEESQSFFPWQFGVEAGYVINISSDPYSGLITPVPDPTNVGSLQDPIITEVKKGSGYRLRLFAEKKMRPFLVSQVGLGYRQQTFKYTAKKNPTTGAVRLDQLQSFEEEIKLDQVELGAGVSYLQFVGEWTFGYGVHLDFLYNLTGKKKIDVLVPSGPFFKNTPSSVEDGPETLDYQLRAKVDVRRSDYRFTAGVAQDGSFTFSLGYVFW